MEKLYHIEELTEQEKDKIKKLERELEELKKNSVSKQDVMKLVQQALMKTTGQIKVKKMALT